MRHELNGSNSDESLPADDLEAISAINDAEVKDLTEEEFDELFQGPDDLEDGFGDELEKKLEEDTTVIQSLFEDGNGRKWTDGHIARVDGPSPYLLKAIRDDRGYIGFSYAGLQKRNSVARIVLISFKGWPPLDKSTVDHHDENSMNDNLENLKFMSVAAKFAKGGTLGKRGLPYDMSKAPPIYQQQWQPYPRLSKIEVSREGFIRNFDNQHELVPLSQKRPNDHLHFFYPGVFPWVSVHRAVVETFVGKIAEGKVVHHRNTNIR
ncbi:hypothetical protein DFS34DRAFT_593411 [Phlyctochytrium arcticum]|nr:hypothetical protein DFS34DRAFT_593411 [Phlyctochytrium arcticum]